MTFREFTNYSGLTLKTEKGRRKLYKTKSYKETKNYKEKVVIFRYFLNASMLLYPTPTNTLTQTGYGVTAHYIKDREISNSE